MLNQNMYTEPTRTNSINRYWTIWHPEKFYCLQKGRAGMLFSLDELRDDFSDMQIQTLELIEFEVEEGEFHRGKASRIKMVAFK